MAELEAEASKATFWNIPEKAQKLLGEQKKIKKIIEPWTRASKETKDHLELLRAADPAADVGLISEIGQEVSNLKLLMEDVERQASFKDPADARDCILIIQSGAGGVDAMDWAEQLERMYLRHFEREGFIVQVTDRLKGSTAGIHYSEIEVSGPYAYGKLISERGVHRVQHVSRFDANGKKQTSFASVDVIPVYSEVVMDLQDKDLEIETMRSGGPGGQGVQTTDSAVRIRHIPSGISVRCQSQRSQMQNKKLAMEILVSKLKKHEEDRKEKRQKLEASFGHQTRSYVLEPYQLVKDHISGYETSATGEVLDGDLTAFSEAFLSSR